jgi:hypothetical protein
MEIKKRYVFQLILKIRMVKRLLEIKLQIISDNNTRVSIVMACISSTVDKNGNIFKIEDLYYLNFNESKTFGYIDK